MYWFGSDWAVGSSTDQEWRQLCQKAAQIRQAAFILSASLIILGWTGDPTYAQDQQSRQIVSACRSDTPPLASGKMPEVPPKSREATLLVRSSASFLFAGAYEKVVERLNQAAELDPDNARLYTSRGLARLRNRQVDKALDDYNHSISLDPEPPRACRR